MGELEKPMTRPMTSAEFKLTRLYLGYPLRQLAEHLEAPYSSAADWEGGRYNPPADVAVRMRELVALTDEAVTYLTRYYEARPHVWPIKVPYNQAAVDAGVYRDVWAPDDAPVGWWRMVLARVAHNIPDAPVDWT